MAKTTVTKAQTLTNAISTLSTIEGYNAEELEVLKNMLDHLNQPKALTKVQKANIEAKPIILEALRQIGAPAQVGTIVKTLNTIEGYENYSTPKVTPILRAMIKDGTVANVVEKKVSLYSVVE